jgi:serine protease Do
MPSTTIIQAPDGQTYLPYQILPRLASADLAAIQFISSNNYAVVELGDSSRAKPGDVTYVAGHPSPQIPEKLPFFLVTTGHIATILSQEQARDGYAIAYDNLTYTGMGGGPVLNEAGELIAIYGRIDSEQEGSPVRGPWLKLGVPINLYKIMQVNTP